MYTAFVLGDLNNTGYAYICGPTSIFFLPAPTQCQFQRPSWRKNISILVCTPPTPREGDLARYVPLRAPTPLKSILLQTIDPILVSFEQM